MHWIKVIMLASAMLMPSDEQTGIASYYGKKFHGRRTASGEKYNKNWYTAAHRSYPFGTILKVTRVSNGRSVLVKVNDRGPYIKKRIIDVSWVAARDLDLLQAGRAMVKVETVEGYEWRDSVIVEVKKQSD